MISITSTIMLLLLSSIRPGISLLQVLPIVAYSDLGHWDGMEYFLTLAGEYSNPGYEAVGTSVAFSIAMTGQIVGRTNFRNYCRANGKLRHWLASFCDLADYRFNSILNCEEKTRAKCRRQMISTDLQRLTEKSLNLKISKGAQSRQLPFEKRPAY